LTCGQSSLQNMYQTEHWLYKLNDISEAGASVISDIILDYVKLPVEGDYTTQNKKNKKIVSEVQHQPQVQRINNNKQFPNHLEAIVPLEQNMLMAIFNHWHF
jgi:hypothetical protein